MMADDPDLVIEMIDVTAELCYQCAKAALESGDQERLEEALAWAKAGNVGVRTGSNSGGMPSCAPTRAWNFPNIALVDVFDPDRATPMKPRIGATMTNAVPIDEKPFASDDAMPEKLKM